MISSKISSNSQMNTNSQLGEIFKAIKALDTQAISKIVEENPSILNQTDENNSMTPFILLMTRTMWFSIGEKKNELRSLLFSWITKYEEIITEFTNDRRNTLLHFAFFNQEEWVSLAYCIIQCLQDKPQVLKVALEARDESGYTVFHYWASGFLTATTPLNKEPYKEIYDLIKDYLSAAHLDEIKKYLCISEQYNAGDNVFGWLALCPSSQIRKVYGDAKELEREIFNSQESLNQHKASLAQIDSLISSIYTCLRNLKYKHIIVEEIKEISTEMTKLDKAIFKAKAIETIYSQAYQVLCHMFNDEPAKKKPAQDVPDRHRYTTTGFPKRVIHIPVKKDSCGMMSFEETLLIAKEACCFAQAQESEARTLADKHSDPQLKAYEDNEELSNQAFDYIMNNKMDMIPDVSMYQFENEERYFLALNRDIHSDPFDPLTWGDNAVICDPRLNLVCSVKEYFSHPSVEKFAVDIKKDRLGLVKECVLINQDRLYRNAFQLQDFNDLAKKLESYHTQLIIECKRIYNKNKEDYHPAHADKLSILYKRIAAIKSAKYEVNYFTQLVRHPEIRNKNFSEAEALLYDKKQKRIWNKAIQSMQFSKTEQAKLFDHAREGLLTHAMRFFNVKTATEINIRSLDERIGLSNPFLPK